MGREKRSAEGQGTVLRCFHFFALARPFVIKAAEVKNAVNNDTVQFLVIVLAVFLGVGAHGVQRDDKVAADGVTLAVVEGDDVRVTPI